MSLTHTNCQEGYLYYSYKPICRVTFIIYSPILLLRKEGEMIGEEGGEGERGTSSAGKRPEYVSEQRVRCTHQTQHGLYWGMKLKGREVYFQLLYVPKYYLSICKNYSKQKPKKQPEETLEEKNLISTKIQVEGCLWYHYLQQLEK